MRHAFLIIAHNNWGQLKNLIQLLDDEENDIFVHIDKKSTTFDKNEFDGLTAHSTVNYYQEYKVFWGGYSQVQVELFLIEEAHKNGYDYYHIISGADLPLKTNREIHKFIEDNNGKEFIDFDENKLCNDPEIKRRTKLYHFLQNYRRRFRLSFLNGIFTFAERLLLGIQIVFHVDRTRHLNWEIKYGSNWVSITNNLVEVLLKQQSNIENIFRWTNCSDELFIQTVAYNCGFKDKIYCSPIKQLKSNLRYIDWKRGSNGNPYTFRKNDYDSLISSPALFARKFSETVDNEIIVLITRYLQQKQYGIGK